MSSELRARVRHVCTLGACSRNTHMHVCTYIYIYIYACACVAWHACTHMWRFAFTISRVACSRAFPQSPIVATAAGCPAAKETTGAMDGEVTSSDESDAEKEPNSKDDKDSKHEWVPPPPNSNITCRIWTCERCPDMQTVYDRGVDICSDWKCGKQGWDTVRCNCGGALAGHVLSGDICRKPRTCRGRMYFDKRATSLHGGGCKHLSWHAGDPALPNRIEGRCCECWEGGKFEKVAQECTCSGIMVIQIDHMPFERERIGEVEMAKRRKKGTEQAQA